MKPAQIQSGFWHKRLAVNAERAIFHQWEQLEASGCIENFRIAAGKSDGLREGWFFADSDAYKWLEAAARIQAAHPDPHLSALIDAFIDLLAEAQSSDGYLFTYNQVHFPTVRWQNLQIEHELYCHGHLIEAGVSHYEATGRTDLLSIVRKVADRIVADFSEKGPAFTPGHEEIEIALLRLHQVCPGDTSYLDMARQFVEQRGRTSGFALSIFKQNLAVNARRAAVRREKQAYLAAHPGAAPFHLPPPNAAPRPPLTMVRWFANVLNGKYFQQHAPVREQTMPVGHSVRFAYFETAVAMLARETGDRSLLPALEQAWDRMVTRRMYVTGGIGSLPVLEGFGRDFELDPHFAYAETCAALASMFWSWQMARLTGYARYSDLFEWQLYNAALVGMGLDGTSYLYNNPLACRGGVTRQPWYDIPCCPSNLSRTFEDLGRYVFSASQHSLFVHQYFSCRLDADTASHPGLEMETGLPWEGRVRIRVSGPTPAVPRAATLRLRQPSWAAEMRVRVNAETPLAFPAEPAPEGEHTASGYDPRSSIFRPIERLWQPGDEIQVSFDLPVRLLHAHPKVKNHAGKVAVTRGPLVYCLESLDQPDVDLFNARIDPASLTPVFEPDCLGGVVTIQGYTQASQPLTFIPYYAWGNRGPSQMTVWVNA
jgi:uncharacterized protein